MKSIPGIPDLHVGSVYCIGRNYSKHAAEMGSEVPDEPMVFLKPAASIIYDGDTIRLPLKSTEVHHEVELVIAIGKSGKNIPREQALQHVAGYGIGIDVTARDIQAQAKKKGHPWSVAKGFDTFAPISKFKKIDPTTDFNKMELTLQVNDETRQHGFTRHMIFPVDVLIHYLSTIFSLSPGDLIFTGTPEGVSPIQAGDTIRASLNNNELTLNVSVDYD